MNLPRVSSQPIFKPTNFNLALMKSVLVLLVLIACSTTALAHKPSDSFLNIERNADSWRIRWVRSGAGCLTRMRSCRRLRRYSIPKETIDDEFTPGLFSADI